MLKSKRFIFFVLCIFVIPLILLPNISQAQPCYAITLKNPTRNIESYLVAYYPESQETTYIGKIDSAIKAIAINPSDGKIYTVKGNEFGTLSSVNGSFTKISDLGSIEGKIFPTGENITATPDSIRCMTFDPFNNVIYAVDYNRGVEPGTEDILFKIDPTSGEVIEGGMLADETGIRINFAGIPEVVSTTNQGVDKETLRDVWDIAIGPEGELTCYHRQGEYAFLTILNKETGQIETEIIDLSFQDYYGMAFSTDGTELYFTAGDGTSSLEPQDPSILWERDYESSYLGADTYIAGYLLIKDEDLFYRTMDCGIKDSINYQPCNLSTDVINFTKAESVYKADQVLNSNLSLAFETEFYAGQEISLEPGFETTGYDEVTNNGTQTVYHNFTADIIENCN